MAMQLMIVPVTAFAQNCSVLWCDKTRQAAVVDSGGDLERVEQVLKQQGLTLQKILLTHGHVDHAAATAELVRRHQVPVEGPHRADRFLIDDLPRSGRQYGFQYAESFTPTRWLAQGDTVTVGEETLQVRHCPGHTPGHVVFVHTAARFALVGDVLFQGSIGRTDFPGGNHAELIRSIRENLFPLGDDIRFVPGHGPLSTFGEERRHNPFVGDHVVRSG